MWVRPHRFESCCCRSIFFWFHRVVPSLENSLGMGWDQVLLLVIHERDLEGYQIRHSGK